MLCNLIINLLILINEPISFLVYSYGKSYNEIFTKINEHEREYFNEKQFIELDRANQA